jgi:cellulose synthase operon protein C
MSPRRALPLLAALLACAGPGATGGGATRAARGGVAALLANDPARAASRLRADAKDPGERLAAALLARRELDTAGEIGHLLAVVEQAPASAAALLALRRLGELAEAGPVLAERVEAGLAPHLALGGAGAPISPGRAGKLHGLAAYRARAARAAAAEARGDPAGAAVVRAENGSVTTWTLSGPFGELPAMDFDREVPPERGEVPAAVARPWGRPPQPSRTLPTPDGTGTLEGEPEGDVYALSADATLARGGRYVVALATPNSARLRVDGALVHVRRAFADRETPIGQAAVVELAPGRHRVVLVLARAQRLDQGFQVSLARDDGAPADVTWAPAAPGAAPAGGMASSPSSLPSTAKLGGGRAIEAGLEPVVGPVLARVLAARDVMVGDRELAKALLAEARALAPSAAVVRGALAEAAADDPSLDPQVARGRSEAELREALRLDAGDADARLRLAESLAEGERHDDAAAVLAGLSPEAAARPRALAARGRSGVARNQAEMAEALVLPAVRDAASCDAADLVYEQAIRRGAVAREDEAAAVLGRCRRGRERLASHARRRGDATAEAAALAPLVAARPWAIDPGLARAEARLAAGDARGAAAAAAELAAVWPRSPRVLKKLADVRELAGDRAGARAAREAALAADPGDLALRRALALEDGTEVLADLAEDGTAAIRAYEAAGKRGGVSAVMVLDAAAVEIHPGGAGTERTHQVIHVVDQTGVERWGEVTVPSGADVLTLRTLKPDGRVVYPDRSAGGKGTVSLAGLEPGDYVDLEYLRSDRGPRGAGWVASSFFFQVTGMSLFRSTYVVRAPAGLGLGVDAHGMPAPAVVREGPWDVIRAERRDVPALVPEPDGPGGAEFLPLVSAGIGGGREVVLRGYGEGLAATDRGSREVAALAEELRKAAGPGATPAALVRAAYARVQKDVLGDGSLGEEGSDVLSRGRGSRLAALQALLRALGIPSRVALVRPFQADPSEWRFPLASRQFSNPLLRVRAGGETFWLDPTTRHAPFRAFASTLSGCDAWIVPAPGEAPEVDRTPAASAVPEQASVQVRITLAPDGGADVAGTHAFSGVVGAALKQTIEGVDGRSRVQAMEGMLSRMFRGVTVREAEAPGLEDPDAPAALRFAAHAEAVARPVEGGAVIEAALFPSELGRRYVQVARRETPLVIPAPEVASWRIELVPAPGMKVAGTGPRVIESRFGRYTRAERAEGGALVREDRLEVRRGRISPADYRDFAAFAAAVDELQDRPVLVAREPAAPAR